MLEPKEWQVYSLFVRWPYFMSLGMVGKCTLMAASEICLPDMRLKIASRPDWE